MKQIMLNSSNLNSWKKEATPSVMALGFFDGIHQGHKKVIQTAGEIAREKGHSLTVMSFFPHPKTILSNGSIQFDYVMPLSKKASILEALGVDTFYVVECNKDFLSLLPEQFVSAYLHDMNVVHAVGGFDFTYGYKASGHIDRLKADSFHRIEVTKVEKESFCGRKVSSTWIRELIYRGNIERLSTILGRRYETEVYWDGECFCLLPYYTIPGEGIYEVVIEKDGNAYEADVLISENEDAIYIMNSIIHDFHLNERWNISWVEQITNRENWKSII